MIIPQFYDLMGSQHPGYTGRQGASWQMPDTANTSSIRPFYFHGVMPQIWWAAWTLIWRPGVNGTSKSRLIAMDTSGPGYGTWETLVEFNGPANQGPIVSGVDVTGKMNAFVAGRISKYIGFQMWDDGNAAYDLWESRLEVNWLLPEATQAMRAALAVRIERKPLVGKVVHAKRDKKTGMDELHKLPQPPPLP